MEDISKLCALLAATEFCEWVKYISLIINISSSFTNPHGFKLLMLLS